MSGLYDWRRAADLHAADVPFDALIMAAALKADGTNLPKLRTTFPELMAETFERSHTFGGRLDTDGGHDVTAADTELDPPILYWSRTLARQHGDDSYLAGLIDMTVPDLPMAFLDSSGTVVLPELPADAVWLSGGERATEWGVRWPSGILHHHRSRGLAEEWVRVHAVDGAELVKRHATRSPWEVSR